MLEKITIYSTLRPKCRWGTKNVQACVIIRIFIRGIYKNTIIFSMSPIFEPSTRMVEIGSLSYYEDFGFLFHTYFAEFASDA